MMVMEIAVSQVPIVILYLDKEVRNIITRSYDFTNEAVITNKPETSKSFFVTKQHTQKNEVVIVQLFFEHASAKKTRVWATAWF